MKASYQKETLENAATAASVNRSPVLRTEGDNRFVKKGESRECFYFGVARKLIGHKWSLLILFILKDGCMRFGALLSGILHKWDLTRPFSEGELSKSLEQI